MDLDANLKACVLLHLTPADLASVTQTCSDLRHETESEVVWCTLFLRRFGSDFWGEATIGPHPYTSVPERANAWLEHPISDLFARFSLRSERESEGENGESDDEDEDGIGHAAALREFVRSHATRDGYGGWKQAYRRMHEMVTEWRKPVDSAFILAGLPSFSTLSAIANIIKEEALKSFSSFASSYAPVPSDADIHLEADIVSPGGKCRVIRVAFCSANEWGSPVQRLANICVIRRPRNWYRAKGKAMFCGLTIEEGWGHTLKLIYVVNGQQMERSDTYQERVYRELHGVLGEGKGQFEKGLAVALFLVNASSTETAIQRLKLPRFVAPVHMCPYYAGPVYFVVTRFNLLGSETAEYTLWRQEKVARAFVWLAKQPSSRPHWDAEQLVLCALSADP